MDLRVDPVLTDLHLCVDAIARVLSTQAVTQERSSSTDSDVGAGDVVVVVAAANEAPRRVGQRNSRVHGRPLLDGSSGWEVTLEPVLVVEVEGRRAGPIAQTSARR